MLLIVAESTRENRSAPPSFAPGSDGQDSVGRLSDGGAGDGNIGTPARLTEGFDELERVDLLLRRGFPSGFELFFDVVLDPDFSSLFALRFSRSVRVRFGIRD